MSWLDKLNPLSGIIEKVTGVVGELVEDKDKANAIVAKIKELDFTIELKKLDASFKLLMTEMTGSWLQKNWRPITMLSFVWIIFWNYFLAGLFNVTPEPIPTEMWALLKLGMGGYIIGRSVEKGVKHWKNKS